MVKLKDIAAKVGISIATASNALSGKRNISSEVAEKVRETAKEMGYVRRVNKNQVENHSLALLHLTCFPITWMFERDFIIQIEKSCKAQNLSPSLICINNYRTPNDLFDAIITSKVQGVFSIHFGSNDIFYRLKELGIPVILINDSSYQDKFDSVLVDDFQGAYEGTYHLIKSGHTRIGYIQFDDIEFDKVNLPFCKGDRFIGFKKAIDEESITFPDEYNVSVESKDFNKTVKQMRSLFSTKNKPTALFVQDDHLAGCIHAALSKIGLSVPRDVSLIAPGDVLDYSLPFTPSISTMRINSSTMAKLACDLMFKQLRKPDNEIQVLKVKQQLIDRGSIKQINK
jgi:LacI family transcriptional regulator, galactose operon repressor